MGICNGFQLQLHLIKVTTSSHIKYCGSSSAAAARTSDVFPPQAPVWLLCEVYRSRRRLLPSLTLSSDALWRQRRLLLRIFAQTGTVRLINVVPKDPKHSWRPFNSHVLAWSQRTAPTSPPSTDVVSPTKSDA